MKNCRSCGREIVFMRTSAGKIIPVDADSVAEEETADAIFEYGRHISHFATCPDANKFRKPKEN